jgi:hypothetical protein
MIDLSRTYLIFVCKDGTVTYGPKGTPPFNGVALPVHSVDSIDEARQVQVALCRRQYVSHPDMPGQPWYVLSKFSGNTGDLPRVAEEMQRISRQLASENYLQGEFDSMTVNEKCSCWHGKWLQNLTDWLVEEIRREEEHLRSLGGPTGMRNSQASALGLARNSVRAEVLSRIKAAQKRL